MFITTRMRIWIICIIGILLVSVYQAIIVPLQASSSPKTPPNGTLLMWPHTNATEAAGYDALFDWSYTLHSNPHSDKDAHHNTFSNQQSYRHSNDDTEQYPHEYTHEYSI